MHKFKSSLLLSIPVFIVFIWTLAMAEPSTQSISAYLFYAVVASVTVGYSTVMAVEYISQQ